MPRKIPSDDVLKAFAEEHLAYEVNMLLHTSKILSQPNNPQFITNVFLESYTIHLRTLIDFIWEPPNLKSDDAIASDFFNTAKQWEQIRPSFPPELQPARSRTGKEIVHLTYARMEVTSETKHWNFSEMTKEMAGVLKVFAENADKSRIGKALADI